jgi:arabinofuranosyltransferase
VTNPGITGHEKPLPWSWVIADFAAPSAAPFGATAEQIAAARRALQCGELAELLASVREPMSAGRFWDNLTGSIARTRLVIPADPIEAERKFCGH